MASFYMRAPKYLLVFSLLYSLGLLTYLSFPDRYTPLVIKIIAFLFLFVMLSTPTVIFLLCLREWKKVKSRWRTIMLVVSAALFPCLWIGLTSFIVAATRSDALGGLSFFLGTFSQAGIFIIVCLIMVFKKESAAGDL